MTYYLERLQKQASVEDWINRIRVQIFVLLLIIVSNQYAYADDLTATVTGDVESMSDVSVILENRTELWVTQPASDGTFTFEDIEPGDYFVKVEATGYRSTGARKVSVPISEDLEPFTLERITGDAFMYHWEEDQSTAGLEYTSQIVQPVQVEFLGKVVDIVDSAESGRLLSEFNVVLVEDDLKWTSEHSYRLSEMLMITAPFNEYHLKDLATTEPQSRWSLVSEEITEDIEVTLHEDGTKDVRISASAFGNASPKLVQIEGRRGIWYSQRLHHAVIRYVTDFGRDKDEVARILDERYGVRLRPDYDRLTAGTTGDTSSSFQDFHANEFVEIINMLEEMPKGFHKIPELKYIIRRIDGVPHPLYPAAPAVAWPNQGYIEFMESAFTQSSVLYIHRLILHEKAHFLWAHVLDEQTRDDWIELGEWYEDPKTVSGWSTNQTTQFVSAYAHLKDPNEDMAESIADFVLNPNVLIARAPDKYDFIRDRLMAGNFYVSKIRDDLTFEVYNLFPDYVYPGKIKRVDLQVEGERKEDKKLTLEVELHALDTVEESASQVYLRIVSDVGTYFDMFLHPIDEDGTEVEQSVLLRGSVQIPKFSKAGYWYPHQLRIDDNAGNARYQRENSVQMKIFVDNPLEDYFAPEYVAESIRLRTQPETRRIFDIDREIQVINVSWEVDENNALIEESPCYVAMVVDVENTGSFEAYGQPQNDGCSVDFEMPHYMPSGEYSVRFIMMQDVGRNFGVYSFLRDGRERVPTIDLLTNNPDSTPPELDVNKIMVEAVPTNPNSPNGETRLQIVYTIRDDNSGLTDTSVTIRDPQGGARTRWHDVPDGRDLYGRAEPNEWQTLEMIWILPVGSPPGIWGISSMTVNDKARNRQIHNFTEVIHIEVENDQ